MRHALLLSTLVLSAATSASGQAQGCSPTEAVACTPLGPARGVVDGEIVSFRGLSYARPPVGQLRWRGPQPPSPWSDTRDATRYGPICPQLQGDMVVGDENCLTANVWTTRSRQSPRPVMVYLTGGGNHGQSGQGGGGATFVGTRLVPEGVVLVTANIRLGALGFLSHAALDAENEHRASGNYGSQDHIALLKWVQQNIGSFGGDPKRVFLFGTSAGGATICGLMTSPLATGLFHGAAMESSVPTGCEFHTAAQARTRTTDRLVAAVHCDGAADVAACLRAKTPRDLVMALRAATDIFPRTYGPTIDGYVFPDQPVTRLAAGQRMKIPVLIGNTLEETASFIGAVGPVTDANSYRAAIERIFGSAAVDRIIEHYPPNGVASPHTALVRATTDALFTCATRRVERAVLRGGGGPVFRYLFTYRREATPSAPVAHSVEMPYVFGSWTGFMPTSRDREMSDIMVRLWTTMAKTGVPGGHGPSTWTAGSQQHSPYFDLNLPATERQGDAGANCDFWDSVPLPSPHL